MSLKALVASSFFALLPPLDAPTRTEMEHWRSDVRRMERELASIGNDSDIDVATNLARMEAHLHWVRAVICKQCEPGQLAPSVYDDFEQTCGEGTVTTSLSSEEYARRMARGTHWMRDHLAHMSREKSPYERRRLGYIYYNRIRDFIEQARPACRDTDSN